MYCRGGHVEVWNDLRTSIGVVAFNCLELSYENMTPSSLSLSLSLFLSTDAI